MQIRLGTQEKATLIGNLATLLSSGIPILDAVNSALEDTKGSQKKILETLKSDLVQGKYMSASFAKFPLVFDRVTVNLIKAAEEAGTLETVLKDLRDHILKENEFLDKVKLALIYPMFIVAVFGGVLIMILTFVVPKVAVVFSRLKVELPWPTKAMIFVSNLLLNHTLFFLVGTGVLVGGIIFLFNFKKSVITGLFYRLPYVSSLVKNIDLTRFSRNMYLLLSSGIPITSALELTQEVVLRSQTAKLILKTQQMIGSGKRLAEGLRTNKKEMPTIVLKLIEAGEKSGTLDKSMLEISTFLDYQVTNSLKAATAAIEPVLLLVVGVTVGLMMMAIIGPIYGLIGQVGGR